MYRNFKVLSLRAPEPRFSGSGRGVPKVPKVPKAFGRTTWQSHLSFSDLIGESSREQACLFRCFLDIPVKHEDESVDNMLHVFGINGMCP